MPVRQCRLHYLDRLDFERHDVTAGSRQLEHVIPQVALHRPSIDPHDLSAPLVELRPQRAARRNLNPSWSSSEGRQGLSVVETR